MTKAAVKPTHPSSDSTGQQAGDEAIEQISTDAKPNRLSKLSKKSKSESRRSQAALTLGECAHQIMTKQYQQLVKQESGVLQDTDPEHLHQMRVATRRLRTALQIFDGVVKLPKPAREKSVQALTKVLGKLRDLDVQTSALQEHYRPKLSAQEQSIVDQATALLHKRRVKALAEVKATLDRSDYQNLKVAYERWLKEPEYTVLGQLPLQVALPDVLSPLLSKLLLHPGWLIAAEEQSQDGGTILHELRKTCKQVRYQAEFFGDFYGSSFRDWVDELKQLQENLGIVQDTHVLLDILTKHLSSPSELPQLQSAMQQQQTEAMANWDAVRTRYLDVEFRRRLHSMILGLKS